MEASIVSVPTRWVAYRSGSSSLQELGASIQEMLGPIYGLQGVSGTPYARYLEWRDEDCDFQVGVLLRQRVAASGDISVDLYAACLAVHVEYKGTYEGRTEAHLRVREYLQGQGLTPGGPMWEVFDGPPNEEGIAKVLVYLPIQPASPR